MILNSSFLYRCILLLAILGNTGCRKEAGNKLPSLRETYRNTDKQPFGGFLAFNQFSRLFGDRYIEQIDDPFDDTWTRIKSYTADKKYSLYFLVARNFVVSYSDVNAFMDYVKAGNDLFISADYIDNRFLESINCSADRIKEISAEMKGDMHQTNVKMYLGKNFSAPSFGYYYYPFLNSLADYDSAFTTVLGVNEMNQPNFVVMFSGRGRIYLHVAPRIFGNYFLLTNDNYKYFEHVISWLRPDPKDIYWDEYYKSSGSAGRRKNSSQNNDNFSTLSVIRQHIQLLWAFWIAAAGMMLFIFFNVKRKQRVIPVMSPNLNTTVAFTETIGRLYLQKKDNRHIAEKMITYFYEHLRNHYFIGTVNVSEEFIKSLSGKSGVPKETTKELFSLITQILTQEKVDDPVLLRLNTGIENFIKHRPHG